MMEKILLLAAIASLASAQGGGSDASSITSATDSSNTASATDSATSTTRDPITHTVDVGFGGHTFQPDVVQPLVGDTVEFQFGPTNHSVIRAEYLMPCVPYEMTGRGKVGFDSGFRPVDTILDEPPVFRLLINDSDPIFYYCGAEGSCINWQMVGVINPNANTSLQAHKQAAKDSAFMLLPGEKWPDESHNPMDDPTSTGTSTPTGTADAASQTSSGAGSSSNRSSGLSSGAIAGIAVGGTVAVIGAAALLFFCGRASRRRNAAAAAQQQPLMQQGGNPGAPPPFSPGPNSGHMSYVQPYPTDMNKHMSVQSMSMHSPALPGYVPHSQQQVGTPLYGPSDALNPGHENGYLGGSPQQSPHMVPMYAQQQQRNSMQQYGMQPQSPQTPFAAPHPSVSPPPQQMMSNQQYHEMPAGAGPAMYPVQMAQSPHTRPGGSELSGDDRMSNVGGQGQQGQQGQGQGQQGGGIMNFIKQNTGS